MISPTSKLQSAPPRFGEAGRNIPCPQPAPPNDTDTIKKSGSLGKSLLVVPLIGAGALFTLKRYSPATYQQYIGPVSKQIINLVNKAKLAANSEKAKTFIQGLLEKIPPDIHSQISTLLGTAKASLSKWSASIPVR